MLARRERTSPRFAGYRPRFLRGTFNRSPDREWIGKSRGSSRGPGGRGRREGAGGMSLRLPGLYRASSTGGPLNNNALKEHTQASRQSARVAGSKRRKTAAFRSADRTYYRRPRDVPVHVINCCGKYVPCTSGEFAPLERTMANDK